jgi:hypothetical protein
VLDATKKLRLANLEEDEDKIILKSIMYINLALIFAEGAGWGEEAEAGLPGGGRGQNHPEGHHGQ